MGKKLNGHELLLIDLYSLYKEAEGYEFHDFENNKYATPKVELANKLEELRSNVISGKYDNHH